jgi:mono/diheme cytochrome c family protein
MRARRNLVLAAVCLLLAGCGGEETVSPTAEDVQGTLPQAQPVSGGDPAAGKTLFDKEGCNSCHTYGPAKSKGTVGPNLDKLEADAKKANQGSLQEYTATSIKNPSAYITPGFPPGVMPPFDKLSDEQIADLVAFLTKPS